MAKIWAERIIAGTRVFSQVPARYQDEVRSILIQKLGAQDAEPLLNT